MAPHSISILVAMVATYAASRAAAVGRLLTRDYVRAKGRAKPVTQRMQWNDTLQVGVFGAVPLLWLGPTCATLTVAGLILTH